MALKNCESAKMVDVEKIESPSPVDKGHIYIPEADKAFEFLRLRAESDAIVDVDEKKLLIKIDWMIIP